MISPISPCRLWAVVCHNPRSRWIYYPSVQRTRKLAIAKYLEGWSDPVKARKMYRRDLRKKRISVEHVEVIVEGSR